MTKKIKRFKKFVIEAPIKTNRSIEEPSKQKEVTRVHAQQQQQKKELKARQDAEIARAREQDFNNAQARRDKDRQDAENKRKATDAAKNEGIEEVLEIGTDEIVTAYKKVTPGE